MGEWGEKGRKEREGKFTKSLFKNISEVIFGVFLSGFQPELEEHSGSCVTRIPAEKHKKELKRTKKIFLNRL
jgi:hypothetical protein